ncbi:hypothetical protein OG948_55470 (plasmid) [Embleya sp. NBC_00888]|uniref:hypothetical protein n=1 Tax=Embleya sp. NBC_00888 TaxID=2975960 RepID=UPI002F90AB9D|nr:hypothetical protein OG948_55470 [Embleya sp. NBC_00888]
MSDASNVVPAESAMVAAGRGNAMASRLVDRAHAQPGRFRYTPACALVEADRIRLGTAGQIGALPGVGVLELHLSAVPAIASDDIRGAAHARHAVQATPERPDGALVATTVPDRWAGRPGALPPQGRQSQRQRLRCRRHP